MSALFTVRGIGFAILFLYFTQFFIYIFFGSMSLIAWVYRRFIEKEEYKQEFSFSGLDEPRFVMTMMIAGYAIMKIGGHLNI